MYARMPPSLSLFLSLSPLALSLFLTHTHTHMRRATADEARDLWHQFHDLCNPESHRSCLANTSSPSPGAEAPVDDKCPRFDYGKYLLSCARRYGSVPRSREEEDDGEDGENDEEEEEEEGDQEEERCVTLVTLASP